MGIKNPKKITLMLKKNRNIVSRSYDFFKKYERLAKQVQRVGFVIHKSRSHLYFSRTSISMYIYELS